MAFHYLVFVVILQAFHIQCHDFEIEVPDKELQERQVASEAEIAINSINPFDSEIPVTTDINQSKNDPFEFFFGSSFGPMSATDMISKLAVSGENPDKKVEEIKNTIEKITASMQTELYKLLESAINVVKRGKPTEERERTAKETPMDSAKLVMRLLNHIKSHNEHQNIAIEKMMTAQEIADKFGIEFNPDQEIILDLAAATSKQAKILNNSLISNDSQPEETIVEFVPLHEDNTVKTQTAAKGQEYYKYELHQNFNLNSNASSNNHSLNAPNLIMDANKDLGEQHKKQTTMEKPGVTQENVFSTPQYYYWQPIYEDHVMAQHVGSKPNMFCEHTISPNTDNFIAFAPVMEETTTYTVLPEVHEPEPEMVGEEYEETVSSKVLVERGEEPGTSTLNHVTTHTLSEKAHFKLNPTANLPQQMQYSFYFI